MPKLSYSELSKIFRDQNSNILFGSPTARTKSKHQAFKKKTDKEVQKCTFLLNLNIYTYVYMNIYIYKI